MHNLWTKQLEVYLLEFFHCNPFKDESLVFLHAIEGMFNSQPLLSLITIRIELLIFICFFYLTDDLVCEFHEEHVCFFLWRSCIKTATSHSRVQEKPTYLPTWCSQSQVSLSLKLKLRYKNPTPVFSGCFQAIFNHLMWSEASS